MAPRHRVSICQFVVLLVVSLFSALPAPGRAAVLRVSDSASGPVHDGASWATAFPSIQPALDAAQPGDEVWVNRGYLSRYEGNLVMARPGVGLYGGFGGTETARDERRTSDRTTLMALDPAAPVVAITAAAAGAVLDALDIQGGSIGVLCDATDVAISGCWVHDNGTVGREGGGVFCRPGSGATLVENAIYGNRARDGGGVLARDASVTLLRNEIYENRAGVETVDSEEYHLMCRGGGVAVFKGQVVIRNNIVRKNVALASLPSKESKILWVEGGGLYVDSDGATVANNTVVDNMATVAGYAAGWSYGGGLYVGSRSGAVANNIFARNMAVAATVSSYPVAGGMYAVYADNVREDVKVRNNLFHQNVPEGSWPDEGGNMVADPLLYTNLPPRPGSPAIDAGDPVFASPEDQDAGHDPRVQGRRVDIGAYETAPRDAYPTRLHVRPEGDDAADGGSWAAAKRTIQSALNAAPEGGEVWVAAGIYAENLFLRPRVALFGGFAGGETSLAARNPSAHRSALDTGGNGRSVMVPPEAVEATLDGFTIRNGDAGWYGIGGGILCRAPKATITKNILTGNTAISGGGLYASGQDLMLVGNVFEANEAFYAEDTPSAYGGGVCLDGGSAVVRGNTFRDNKAHTQDWMTYPQFANVTLAYGGGLYLYGTRADIRDNVFTGNQCTARPAMSRPYAAGSGIYAENAVAVIVNNTLADNVDANGFAYTAFDGLLSGGTIAMARPVAGSVVANNILAFNASGYAQAGGSAALHHNDAFGSAVANYYNVADPTGTDGNLSADPLFLDRAARDYRLRPGSPAIDTGDTSFPLPGETDRDGRPRVQGKAVDMGAYEAAPSDAFTLADVRLALSAAGGLSSLDPTALARLNVEDPSGSALTLRDAARLIRKAAGLDNNP